MKLLVKEMMFRDGSRVRPGTVIDWPDGDKVPPCCEQVNSDGTQRQKPNPKPKQPDTLSGIAKANQTTTFVDSVTKKQ